MPSAASLLCLFAIGALLPYLARGVQWQSVAIIAVPPLLATHGLHTNKLTFGGACTSVAVGWLLLAAGLKYFGTLITFYALGSAATKFRSGLKMRMVSEGGEAVQTYGKRSAQQVAIKGGCYCERVCVC